MKMQLLVSTMNQTGEYINLVNRMNIKDSALICNQSNFEETIVLNEFVKVISNKDRGLSRSRNLLLDNATSDICILSDDDIYYYDNLSERVNKYFAKYPDADVIIFNLDNMGNRYIIKEDFQVSELTYQRFGSVRIAFRLNKIKINKIRFNELFGAGSIYESGEDTIFLKECLDKSLKMYAVNETIGKLTDERESTWFKGLNKKYFFDKGALFKELYKRSWLLWCAQFALRKAPLKGDINKFEAFIELFKGARSYANSK